MSLKTVPFDRSINVSWLEVTRGHSDWYHSKAWVRFPSNYAHIFNRL